MPSLCKNLFLTITFELKHLQMTILVSRSMFRSMSRSMFLRSKNLMVPDGAICFDL